jgi:hypothetical protein
MRAEGLASSSLKERMPTETAGACSRTRRITQA